MMNSWPFSQTDRSPNRVSDSEVSFEDRIRRIRTRHGIYGNIHLAVTCFAFSIYYFVNHSILLGSITGVAVVLSLYLCFYLRNPINYRLGMNFSIGLVLLSITLIQYMTGGPSGPVFVYFAIVPLVSGYYLSSRQTTFWTLATVLIALTTLMLNLFNHNFPNMIPETHQSIYYWVVSLLSIGIIFMYASFYTRIRDEQDEVWKKELERRVSSELQLMDTVDDLEFSQRIAQMGSWRYSSDENRLAFSNQLLDILELEPNEFDGSAIQLLGKIVETDREKFRESLEELLGGEVTHLHEEVQFKVRDGRIKSLLFEGEISTDKSGIIVRGIAQDITRAKNLEHQRDEFKSRMFQTSKMASIGEVSAGVAHEINNPLAVIMGHLDVGIKKIRMGKLMSSDDVIESYEFLKKSTKRIQKIVGDLKNYSRAPVGEVLDFDLESFFNESLEFVKLLYAKEDIKLRLVQHEKDITARGCPDQLQQVILNLIGNARDAVIHRESREIEVSVQSMEQIEIRVSDNGGGIPKSHLPRVFEPFFTTKEVGQGTGLGLGISKQLLNGMGGDLTIESTDSKGTTFLITMMKGNTQLKSESQSDRKESSKKRVTHFNVIRILIVDDEPDLREYLRNALELHGMIVEVAADGKQALSRVREKRFDYVVTDYRMPGLSGPELISRVLDEQKSRSPKFVLISGGFKKTEYDQRVLARERVVAILEKPFSLDEILKVIDDGSLKVAN